MRYEARGIFLIKCTYQDIKEIGLSTQSFSMRETSFKGKRQCSYRAIVVIVVKIQQKEKGKTADVYTELRVIKLPLVIMTYKDVLYVRNELSQHRL